MSKLYICDVICENPSHGAKLIFELLTSFESLNIPFQNILFGSFMIPISKVTDVQRLSKVKKNARIMVIISFLLQFHHVGHVVGFPRSHHIWIYCTEPVMWLVAIAHSYKFVIKIMYRKFNPLIFRVIIPNQVHHSFIFKGAIA